MKTKKLPGIGALFLALAPFAVAAAPDALVSNIQPGTAKSDNAKAEHGPVIDGERFDTWQLTDAPQGGLAVGVVSVPEKWRFNSQVVRNYAHHSNPVAISMNVENPENPEALFSFPSMQLFCLRPISGYYQPGQNVCELALEKQLELGDRHKLA